MVDQRKHWNKVFVSKSDSELGWYESDVSQTLKFLDLIPKHEEAVVFLPGAGTSMLVDELLAKGFRIILNDISDEALSKLAARIGRNEESLIWLCHDISRPLPDGIPWADIWIDRAVLHFLTEESKIQGYFANLNSAVRTGGYALLAEFSTAGPRKCAGLEVYRYSVQEMARRLGKTFTLLAHEDYTYITPAGEERPYIYALFKKNSGQ